ncbi:MAG: response regulator [Treponema sp.]|jgi:signal transduction histidine kinase/FixJ family two-component response regulator/HPt (histidine-containing phosphotransfer) domain-containing protein/HAMP domain-containing protein|nr:response regulator [Treponema sp.]
MQWFRNMKIKSKLLLAFGLLVSMMFFTNILSAWLFVNTDSEYSNMITTTLQGHTDLTKSIEIMTKIRLDLLSRMYSTTNGEHSEIISGMHNNRSELNKAFETNINYYYYLIRFDPDLIGEERQERLDVLSEVTDLFYIFSTENEIEAEVAVNNNDHQALSAILLDSILITDKIADRLDYLYNNAFITVEMRTREVMAESVHSILLISAFSGFFLVFSIFAVVIVVKSIRTPISRMQKAMVEISQGNLSYPIRSPDKDELGKLSNAIGNMVDQISEMNKTVTIMDILDSMIYIVSLNFNIIYLNDRMAKEYGVDKEESIGQKCYKILHGFSRPCPYCLWPRTLSTKEQNKVFSRQRYWDDKASKWIGGKAAIIRWIDGSPVQFYYLVDETIHHNYEAKLQEAADEARAASESKTAFLANMSHEIRTPMNAILGITEIQMENEALPPDTREALGKIYNSGDLLLGIINDILDMSKIEAGKLELITAKYEVSSLINDTVQLNMMRFESKPVSFKLQIDETIPAILIGDVLRIKQILNNLLSNAAKYTPQGEVVFSVSAEINNENDNVMFILRVSDTGQGMTPEQVSKLFDAYTRFNMDVNRTIEGTGLGMSITAELIHMMNGEITVESEAGKGSGFTVRLPQGNAGSGPLGKEAAESLRQFRLNSISQKKSQVLREPMPYGSVLIVDDMEANLYVAKGIMMPYGLHIETVDSGFGAIDKIQSGTEYDIVFMDHMMPKMDGMEATKRMREMGYTRPIVALTADAVAGKADVFLTNGFDDYISKPIDTRRLNDVLNKLIRDKQTPEVIAAARQQHKDHLKNTSETPGASALKTAGSSDDGQFGYSLFDNNPSDYSPLLEELSRVPGLNVSSGLSFIGDNREGYIGVLRFFSEKCESYLEELEKTMKSEAWPDYSIKAHALKGVLANIGAEELSKWAFKLEKASKPGNDFSPALCQEETLPFNEELRVFQKNLHKTLLFEAASNAGKDEKPKGDIQFLREQIVILKEACMKYSFGDTKKIIATLGEYEWDAETEKELENIHQFTISLDYDKALEGMERLL